MRMFKFALLGLLAAQLFVAAPAWALQPVETVYKEVSSFSTKSLSAADVEKAFKTCSTARGWKFTRVSNGKLVGKLNVRSKHSVEVEVEYSSKAFKISYLDSKNMKYNAANNTIHNRYNSWVNNLTNDVVFCLE